jgi:transglutaminase-like putative cysteine protease
LRTRPRFFVILLLAVPGLWAVAAPPSVIEKITLHHGEPIDNLTGVAFDGERFTVPGHDPIPRSDVQTIEFRAAVPGREASPEMAGGEGLTPLAKTMLERGAKMAAQFRGVPGVVLVDDGEFAYHKDGTNSYQYHFAGLVLKEEMKSWAQVTCGFEEGRSRSRIVYGRAIGHDGAVSTLTPDMIKIASPSEELLFFNPNRKVMSGVIPGVEVGSIVEYSYEFDDYSPEDPRLFSPGFSFQGAEPVVFSRVNVTLPKNIDFKYMTRSFPDPQKANPKIEENADTRTYVWQLEDMPPLTPEPLMPPEPDLVPMMEGAIFKDFKEVFDLLRSLQEARIKQTPEIDAKVNEIIKGASSVDEKIAKIYYWVQENTRYISIKGSLGAGFSGHTAQETFENRYGDCTDKAILFATMLKSAGIDSSPVILHTNDSGAAVTEIPTLSGNHCISEVCLPDRSFFLDSTAQNYRYPYFRADDHGVAALNAIKGGIHEIPVPPPSDNQRDSKLEMNLAPNGDLKVRTLNQYNGNVEAGVRGFWKQVREDNRKLMMSEYVNSISPGAVLDDFSLANLEDLSQPLKMTLDYNLPGHAIRANDLMYLRMPTLERDYPEVALETRHYPIQYMTTEERVLDIDLAMPSGFRAKWLPPPLDVSNPYVDYHAKYEERDGHVQFHETFRRLKRIVPMADYPQYRDALRSIAAFSKEEIFLTEKG